MLTRFAALMLSLILSTFATVAAADCKPTTEWRHSHEGTKLDVQTSDFKGSRNTSIEVCRKADPSGAKVEVMVAFEGAQIPIAEGQCHKRAIRWAIVRSRGARTDDGQPAVVSGTGTICKE